MCVRKKYAYDWVKNLHEYQVPHLTKENVHTQVYKGPYWWPTISLDMEHVINKCKHARSPLNIKRHTIGENQSSNTSKTQWN